MPNKKSVRRKWIKWLIGAAVLDMIIPIPFMAIWLIYIVIKRPMWVLEEIQALYAEPS